MVNPDLPPPSPLGPARWKALQTGQMRMWGALFPSPQTAAPQEGQGGRHFSCQAELPAPGGKVQVSMAETAGRGRLPSSTGQHFMPRRLDTGCGNADNAPWGPSLPLTALAQFTVRGPQLEQQTQGSQRCCCYPSPAAKLLQQGGTRVLTPVPDCGSGGRMCQGAGAGGRAESSESLLEGTGITGDKVPGSWNLGAVSKTQEVWGKTVGR